MSYGYRVMETAAASASPGSDHTRAAVDER